MRRLLARLVDDRAFGARFQGAEIETWCIAFVRCFDARLPIVMTAPEVVNLWHLLLKNPGNVAMTPQ